MFNHNREVPYTNGKYLLSETGDIIDLELLKVVSVIENGDKVVRMDWVSGDKVYLVGVVSVLLRNNLKIPVEHWDKVICHYIDGDRTNTIHTNLFYSFKEPIPVTGHPGFFHIPYSTGYGIDRRGTLLRVVDGEHMNWWIKKPVKGDKKNRRLGYRVNRINHDNGTGGNISRHRAKALVFLPYTANPFSLVVNHKNGVGGEDDLENLEWSTHSENTKHAYDNGLQPNNVCTVLVKDTKTGEIRKFDSIAQVCREYGFHHATASGRLRAHNGKPFTDGLAFKLDDDSAWIDCTPLKAYKKSAVVFRNVFTGEQFTVHDCNDAERITGIKAGTIQAHIKRNATIPVRGYLFRWFNDTLEPWPVYSKWQLELFKKDVPKSDVSGWLITDETNLHQELLLLTELSAKWNLDVSTTLSRLRRGMSSCGRYRYEQIKPSTNS